MSKLRLSNLRSNADTYFDVGGHFGGKLALEDTAIADVRISANEGCPGRCKVHQSGILLFQVQKMHFEVQARSQTPVVQTVVDFVVGLFED